MNSRSTNTAALRASWQRRFPRLPAQLGGAGESSNGQAVMVELLIDGVWTDLSILGLVIAADGVQIANRGRPGENAISGPATCDFTAKNFDAAFSFANPSSPYWGKVALGTRVRVSVPKGLGKSYRFQGELSMIPQVSDQSGSYSVVQFEAAGYLRRISQGASPLHSPMYRESTSASYLPELRPIAYWPMEDADGSTTLTSPSGANPMKYSGSPTLATYEGFACSDALPNMNGASFTAKVPTYTYQNPFNNLLPSAPQGLEVSFLISAPSGVTAGATLVKLYMVDGEIWTLTYPSTNTMRLVRTDGEGNTLDDSGNTALAVTILGPTQIRMRFRYAGDPTDSLFVEVFMTDILGSAIANGPSFTSGLSAPMDNVKTIVFNSAKTASDFYIGHLAVHEIWPNDLTIVPVAFQSLQAYAGETTGARFTRLCTEEGVTNEIVNSAGGTGVPMGAQGTDTLLNLLRQCEASDDGIIYEMTSDFGLGYRTRHSLLNQNPVLTLNHGAGELSAALTPLVDDSFVFNDVTVTRVGGTSYEAVQASGPRSTSPSPTGIGVYDTAYDLSLYTDTQVGSAAMWAVHKGTVNEARFKALQVNLNSNELAGTVQRNTILGLTCGDRMVVTGLPVRYGPDDISQLALGFTESIDQFQHYITINCMPESVYRTGVLGSTTKPRAGSSTTFLPQGLGPTDTSIQVSVAAGTARWVDSATYASDFPFDIRVNGERMTVTAISGTSSPQTFTVTRSVNGVVKSHNANSPVTLFVPAYVGM